MGKLKAFRMGIQKGVQHNLAKVLPQTFRCPVCKYEFDAYAVKKESVETGRSPEEIIGGHIIQCIGTLKGQAQCPDCGKMVKGKDFKNHMETRHPIHAPENKLATSSGESEMGSPEISPNLKNGEPILPYGHRESECPLVSDEKVPEA